MVPNTSTLKLSVLTTAMPPSLLVGVGPLVAAVSDEPACFAGSAFFSVSTGTGATTAVALPVPFSGGVVCTAGSSFFSVSAGAVESDPVADMNSSYSSCVMMPFFNCRSSSLLIGSSAQAAPENTINPTAIATATRMRLANFNSGFFDAFTAMPPS